MSIRRGLAASLLACTLLVGTAGVVLGHELLKRRVAIEGRSLHIILRKLSVCHARLLVAGARCP